MIPQLLAWLPLMISLMFPDLVATQSPRLQPLAVENFTCTSYNWEQITCKWDIPNNVLQTSYKLYMNFPGRRGRRLNITCPQDIESQSNECTWSQHTTPIYRQPYEYFFFQIIGKNSDGQIEFPVIKCHHYAIVVPRPVLNLAVVNVTADSIDIFWSIPFPLHNFPPGLNVRVEYTSTRDHWQSADTSRIPFHQRNVTFHLGGLQLSNTEYTIRVMLKSRAASNEADKWSLPATVTARTAATDCHCSCNLN